MDAARLLALARVTHAARQRRAAVAELDEAVISALAEGVSSRTIARLAGLDHKTIIRRARAAGYDLSGGDKQ